MRKEFSSSTSVLAAAAFFILAAGALRLALIDIPNIAPVTAMALFAGTYLRNKKIAFILPLSVMLITDLLLEAAYQLGWRAYSGFYPAMPYVYLSFFLVVFIGILLQSRLKLVNVFAAGLASSVVFFLVSNFGVWISGGYPATVEGLITCYTAAIPFFRYTLVGDLFFIGVFFGTFELVKSRLTTSASA
ncbi:MAG: hypothetical protein KatS3mg031_0114 [Chitinophagales bacterium]|nr:MAG: hypothetical protein KatS3mg031_0114 [Chitinophagales bacterium]